MTASAVDISGEIVGPLQDAINGTFAALDRCFGMGDAARAFRSSRENWSIDESLEHVSLANRYLLLIIEKGTKKAVARADALKIARELEGYLLALPGLEEIGVNNSFPWECPAHMRPSGAASPDATRTALEEQKRRLLEALRRLGHGEGTLCKTRMSVRSLGRLDVYQYIYFLLMHARRHLQQIEEIGSEYRASAR